MNRITAVGRRSHASPERRSREAKARRIEAILVAECGDLTSRDLLDIGTGSGIIASYLRQRTRWLQSVDVVDERIVRDFEFRLVESEELPCEDESVDIVVSNHVIEHVKDQVEHLLEIRRVLRPAGICYLATPNRFGLLEPHYNLPLLSWLPEPLRSHYVRATRRGAWYDVQPLSFGKLSSLVDEAELIMDDISARVASDMMYERLGVRWLVGMNALRPLYPSFVVLLRQRR